jgi:hypothetical protein
VPEISILLMGSTDRSEFRDARSVLDESGDVVAVGDAESALAALEDGRTSADLIVVAQAYPGQFSHEAVDRLRRAAPTGRIVGLLGSWCEGEPRSGQPWPATIRIYWHEWEARVRQEIARLQSGASSSWSLPITAGEEERLLLSAEERPARREGLIAVCTPEFDMQDWLRAAAARRGYASVWVLPHRPVHVEGVTAAVFDATDGRGDEAVWLERLAVAIAPAPIVALWNLPRVDERNRALGAGARAVLCKPLLVEDLFWQLDRLTRTW